MSLEHITAEIQVLKISGQAITHGQDIVVKEVPVTLFLNNEEFVTLVCSPDHMEELAVGFLCSEGILREKTDLKNLTIRPDDGLIWVETLHSTGNEEKFLKRYITTCCGRGRASFYFINDAKGTVPVKSSLQLESSTILNLCSDFEKRAHLFHETGGAHGAALCSKTGIQLFYEDIGRHNAVDKIFGRCFLDEKPLSDKLLVFSGRVSSEILIKIARMEIPILVSRSAPTDLALQMAGELGITVAGFARGERMNIYTHPHRIRLS